MLDSLFFAFGSQSGSNDKAAAVSRFLSRARGLNSDERRVFFRMDRQRAIVAVSLSLWRHMFIRQLQAALKHRSAAARYRIGSVSISGNVMMRCTTSIMSLRRSHHTESVLSGLRL